MDAKGRITAADIPEAEILAAIRRAASNNGNAVDILAVLPQYPPKVVLARVYKLKRKGFLSFRFSERHPWITPAGAERLRELTMKGTKNGQH